MTEAEGVVAKYRQGALTGTELQSAIDEALTEVAADQDFLDELGSDSVTVRGVRFTVVEEGGFGGGEILLAIAVGYVSSMAWDATKLLWKKVQRTIEENYGSDAVGKDES